MAESEVHRRLKLAMARELFEMGYQSNVEIPNGEGGFIDVQGIRGKEIINIELVKTHMPDWVLFKIQSPEEIRYNLFERIVDRLTNRGRKHFHMDELRRNLVATKYFDNESASRYVKRMVDTHIIDEVDPIVGIINNKGRYICDCEYFETTQKECSHIQEHIDFWGKFMKRAKNMNNKELGDQEQNLCKNKSEKLCAIIHAQIQLLRRNKLQGRSNEYLTLFGELKGSFVKAGDMVLKLYKQGKKDGLPNDIIRKDIEIAFGEARTERRIRGLFLPSN
jgi:hypothetical protein